MLHFVPAPCACRHRAEVLCPLAAAVQEQGEAALVQEALPCAVCVHHFTAMDERSRRRVYLGKKERAILLVMALKYQLFYPLIRDMTAEGQERYGNRKRFFKAARRLVDSGAAIAVTLPTQVPKGNGITLRPTTWLQLTAVGQVLSTLRPGTQGRAWSEQKRALARRLADARTRVSEQPGVLRERYVNNLTTILKLFLENVVVATPRVIQRYLTNEQAPYIRARVHLQHLSSEAGYDLAQHFLRTQAALRTLSDSSAAPKPPTPTSSLS